MKCEVRSAKDEVRMADGSAGRGRSATGAWRGFTLIELMVAITILTLLVGIVTASFFSITKTSEIARESAKELQLRLYLRKSFSTNLASVYSDAGCVLADFQFLGETKDGAYGPADTLSFCTMLPMPGAKSLPGVLKQVVYAALGQEELTGGAVPRARDIDEMLDEDVQGAILNITEQPLQPSGGLLEGEGLDLDESLDADTAIERQVPIQSMDILYYDSREKDWVDSWDSLEQQVMPWAVRVKINFARTEAELDGLRRSGIDLKEEPDLDLTITLPTGVGVFEPFIDPNHIGADRYFQTDADGRSGAS